MNDYTTQKMKNLIGMLKYTRLSKEQVVTICGSIPTDKCSDEIVDFLILNKKKLNQISGQEMLNICGKIIEKHLNR